MDDLIGDEAPAEASQQTDHREAGQADRIVTVDCADGAWRVQAAHMEPLRFRSAEDAERAGRRVARNLARMGFGARVDSYGTTGDRTATQWYPAETGRLRANAPRRRLNG